MTFVGGRTAEMVISEDAIVNASFETIVCRRTELPRSNYIVQVVPNNGCESQICCLHMSLIATELRYRMGNCGKSEEDLGSCADFTPPASGQAFYSSARRRSLFSQEKRRDAGCGFSGRFHIIVTSSQEQSCEGRMINLDDVTCKPTSSLIIQLSKCAYLKNSYTLKCEANSQFENSISWLETSEPLSKQQICWQIETESFGVLNSQPLRLTLYRVDCTSRQTPVLAPRQIFMINAFLDENQHASCDLKHNKSGSHLNSPNADSKEIFGKFLSLNASDPNQDQKKLTHQFKQKHLSKNANLTPSLPCVPLKLLSLLVYLCQYSNTVYTVAQIFR